jgi:His-Xaa-Ser system radical SAM maturase HxsB
LIFGSPSSHIKIEFQGGEPLINFQLIQFIIERAEKINSSLKRNLQFVIATNLALIDENILDYCRVHGVLISTSLDGPEKLHNKNRPRPGGNSHEKAINGIRRAVDKLGRESVSALMTTTKESLGQVKAIIDEYIELGMGGIFLRPMSPYGFAIKTKSYTAYKDEEWLDFYFEGLSYIIEINLQGVRFSEHYASLILTKMLTPYSTNYVDLMNPSGIGIAAAVYNYDGDVYASDEGRMLAEMGDKKFRLGNVHMNAYQEIFTSESLLEPLEESFTSSVPMCHECAFESYCGADPVFHYSTQGDFIGNKPTSKFCNRNMAIFRKLISLMEDDSRIKNIFMTWIKT